MPNHVTNELTASPGVLDAIAGEESAVDFNKIVPMPEILNGDVSMHVVEWAKIATGHLNIPETLSLLHRHPADSFGAGNYGAAAAALGQSNLLKMLQEGPFPKDFVEKDFDAMLQCMRALKETGCAYWYDWCPKHWGTKWNAYTAKRVSENVVTFQTAWSPPLPVLASLSDRYPVESLRLRWADEDFGCNVGALTVQCGKVLEGGPLPDASPAACCWQDCGAQLKAAEALGRRGP